MWIYMYEYGESRTITVEKTFSPEPKYIDIFSYFSMKTCHNMENKITYMPTTEVQVRLQNHWLLPNMLNNNNNKTD